MQAFAQRIITGKVLDRNTKEKLNHVDVAIYKGTSTTTSNQYGYFQLTAKEGDSLVLTHPNYKTGIMGIPQNDVFTVYLDCNDDYPAYLLGEAELFNFLKMNLKYPRSAAFKHIEGLVIMKVTIDPEGNMKECRALNEIKGKCSEESVKAFNKIPGKWSKGFEDRNFIFPVVFRLDEENEELKIPDVEVVIGKIMDPILVLYYSGN